ncbi:MAG: hypothetical protein GX053_13720 [Tissierella sp.]|nr:hypothetical protein [Tissierella sp.]
MTNEEFQRIVLEELKALKEGQRALEEGQRALEEGQRALEEGQREIKKELKAITEQTADLTEFRQEVNSELEANFEEHEVFKAITGEHEVDIRRLKKLAV